METERIVTDKITVRRFLLEKQRLWSHPDVSPAEDSDDVLSIIRHLECVQLDPVAVIERNHHLVLYARKEQYEPAHLEALISSGRVFEYMANAACVIPIEDYPLFEPIREYYRHQIHTNLESLEPVMEQMMGRLFQEGALPSRAFTSTTRVIGYWDSTTAKTKDTTLSLNILFDLGRIMIDSRAGNEKFFIPTELKVPEQILEYSRNLDPQLAKEGLVQKYMRAYRVFDFGDSRFGWYKATARDRAAIRDRLVENGEIVPLQMEGIKTTYYILAEDADRLAELQQQSASSQAPTTVKFLPPLDNLLWRRPRLVDLFDFHYKWEIYFPESKRQYGYYAMPILHGDAIVGRMNPKMLQKEKTLLVKLLHIEMDVVIDELLLQNLKQGFRDLAKYLGAERIVIEQSDPGHLTSDLKL